MLILVQLFPPFQLMILNTTKQIFKKTRHVFVKHGCPRRQQSQTMAKISKSYILTPPHPQGHVMSVKCEQPLDELTVQVWLLYDHPNCIYCTLFISGTELRTDGQTDGRTDGQTIQTLDAPGGPFRPGHKNVFRVKYRQVKISTLLLTFSPFSRKFCFAVQK